MIDLAFCIPGDLGLPTGGYRYDRELLARLPAHGVRATHWPLPGGWPAPSDADVAAARDLLRSIPADAILLIDGLAGGAMPPALIASLPQRVLALVHHPLGLEAGLPPTRAGWLLANERAVLAACDGAIVTSRATARLLAADFAVEPARIAVAEPGADRAPRASGGGPPFRLLSVGAVSERKAYPLLVAALAALSDLDWRLTIAGSLSLSPEAAAALRAAVAASDLADRIDLAGAPDDAGLAALYGQADLFVAPSLYEGYGMALAEALARGLPIVASSGGAAAETLPDGAALKVPPGDVPALTAALAQVMTDDGLRRAMADAAWAAAAALPAWDDTARTVADAIRRVAARPKGRAG